MIGSGLVIDSGYTVCGAASDSLLMVMTISITVTLMTLVAGLVFSSDQGFFRKKPLLIPAFAFVISLMLAIALVPHPMAAYHGPNENQIHSNEEDITTFRVYDSIAYQNTVEIHVLAFLSESETLDVRISFIQNDTEIATITITLVGNSLSQAATKDETIQLQPGLYEVEIPGRNYNSVTLSQPLASGFFNEVLDWETYTFLMTVGSFFFIILGVCVAREDKRRYSYEKIDQEPPKDGAEYAKRWQ